ncbi:hypothetical protein Glove_9g272 [Diversispora epigaea]|uniref:HCP-like protein n=1 Tax=Diversispora epigaea TaxID=1348612 RepID=A0A397JSW9_9GLOM|nr:hypothetical protein Glove_9g272 [Diversispora epigaea]
MNEFCKQPMSIPMSRSSTESSAYSEDSSSISLRSPSPQNNLRCPSPNLRSPNLRSPSPQPNFNIRSLSPQPHYTPKTEDPMREIVNCLLIIFLQEQHKCTADKRIVEILEDYIVDNDTTPNKIYQWLLANQNTLQYKSILAFFLKMGLGCEMDLKKSFNLLLTAARKDYMIAEEMVGDSYYTGMGTHEDEVMAFNWYHKTADKGSAYGYHGLGYCYEYGKGTEKCTKKALDCYETSAKMGNMWGMIDLAKMYQEGIGTTKNLDKAIYWYQKAYANGCEKAKNELDKLTNK